MANSKKIGKSQIPKKSKDHTPDAWDILDGDSEHKALVFYKNNKTIATIPITPDVLNEILFELNQHIIIDENIADSWTYRTPLDENLPEYLTIMNSGKILGTLPVDEATGRKLAKQLNKYFESKSIKQRLNQMRKTKKKRFYFLAFISLLVAGVLIYNLILNIIGNFGIKITFF